MSHRELHFTAFICAGGLPRVGLAGGPRGSPLGAGAAVLRARSPGSPSAGALDALFMADNIAIAEYRVEYMPQTLFDPIELLCALAAVTERIGLIATGSTTYSAPWELARRFATLDFLSAGRAGWNIVTTRSVLTAANYGRSEHPSHGGALRARDGVRRGRAARVGRLGGRRGRRLEGDRRLGRPREAPRTALPAASTSRSPASCRSRARRRATRCSSRRAPRRRASTSPRATPSWCSRASRRSRTRSRSAAPCATQAAAAGRSPDHVHVLPALTYTLGATEAEARARQRRARGAGEPRVPLAQHAVDDRPRPRRPSIPITAARRARSRPRRPRAAPSGSSPRRGASACRCASSRRSTPGMPTSLTFVGTPEQLAALHRASGGAPVRSTASP